MTKVRLIVKRRDNGKQVSLMRTKHWRVLAAHLNEEGLGGGVVSLLLPRTAKERKELQEAQQAFCADEVKERKVNNPRNICCNVAFVVEIGEWWCRKVPNPDNLTIVRLSQRLADEQLKIVRAMSSRDQSLEEIFARYEPLLGDTHRKKSWWQAQFRQSRQRVKQRTKEQKS